jgi:hypothetical protein
MNYDIWFSENIEPKFTQEDKDFYSILIDNQFFNIWNLVDWRQLIRCNTTLEKFEEIKVFLNWLWKNIIVIWWQDSEWNIIIDKDNIEFEKFFMPNLDMDGNLIIPAENITSGWQTFRP